MVAFDKPPAAGDKPPAARAVGALPHQKWAPLAEAHTRVWSTVGSYDLALHVLTTDARTERLILAGRWVVPGVADACFVFLPEFWRQATIDFVGALDNVVRLCVSGQWPGLRLGRWYFFVRRAELDKHYPVAAVAAPMSEPADVEPQRLKPGKRPTHPWQRNVFLEVARKANVGESMPTASEMLNFCEEKFGYQPDIRAMQRLLRTL